MCGIAGFVADGSRKLLDEMTDCQVHRGPDDRGIHIDRLPDGRTVGLGSRRLAILDLSPRGRMPMGNPESGPLIVHNGEIYNYGELRSDLRRRGDCFRTETDTEVVLRLYERFGRDMVYRLNGMFSFAIWDVRRRRLLVARDRLGIKPLYYHESGRGFFFASELKGLRAAGLGGEVDWRAIWDYFSYLYVPSPRTAYRGIRELPPGHLLEYRVDDGESLVTRYWSPLEAADSGSEAITLPEARQRLQSLLRASVRQRLVSDVPLGVFLSGGIDSSVLVGLMAEESSEPVKTFTVLFSGSNSEFHDEQATARWVADRWNTDHHELPVDISEPDEMLDLLSCFDQPFGNPTYYLSYLISRSVRDHAKVALSGAGGDELFGGYPRYHAARWGSLLRRTPEWMARMGRRALDAVPDDYSSPTLRRLKVLTEGIDPDPVRQYVNWVYYLHDGRKRAALRTERFGEATDSADCLRPYWEEGTGLDWLGQVQYVDLMTFLPDNILAYTDRTSMATSLEVRVPWLDHELVDFALSLPARLKIRGGTTKYLVRQTFGDYIPERTLRGRKKGFVPPLSEWMESTLDAYFDTHLTPERMERIGVFDPDGVSDLRRAHRSGERDYSMELFSFIVFDAWHRQYME